MSRIIRVVGLAVVLMAAGLVTQCSLDTQQLVEGFGIVLQDAGWLPRGDGRRVIRNNGVIDARRYIEGGRVMAADGGNLASPSLRVYYTRVKEDVQDAISGSGGYARVTLAMGVDGDHREQLRVGTLEFAFLDLTSAQYVTMKISLRPNWIHPHSGDLQTVDQLDVQLTSVAEGLGGMPTVYHYRAGTEGGADLPLRSQKNPYNLIKVSATSVAGWFYLTLPSGELRIEYDVVPALPPTIEIGPWR